MRRTLPLAAVLVTATTLAGCGGGGINLVHDQFVGLTEQQLEAKCGKPEYVETQQSEQMLDEMRADVYYNKLKGAKGVTVRELVYGREDGAILYCWLTQNADGAWVVISDLTVPRGFVF